MRKILGNQIPPGISLEDFVANEEGNGFSVYCGRKTAEGETEPTRILGEAEFVLITLRAPAHPFMPVHTAPLTAEGAEEIGAVATDLAQAATKAAGVDQEKAWTFFRSHLKPGETIRAFAEANKVFRFMTYFGRMNPQTQRGDSCRPRDAQFIRLTTNAGCARLASLHDAGLHADGFAEIGALAVDLVNSMIAEHRRLHPSLGRRNYSAPGPFAH